jgi:post-segregation antitoxin (ccd killing protein)
MSDKLMKQAVGWISKYQHKRLEEEARKKGLPLSRLVAIAIDRELERPDAFKFDMNLPTIEYVEDGFEYADEAGKILHYLRTQKEGLSLDLLLILRHDIGVPDREIFLAAFKVCIDKDFVEKYTTMRRHTKSPVAYHAWRLKGIK